VFSDTQQIIQAHAVQIADTYQTPDAADWKKAAADLRQPFWDWASNSVPPDEIISLEQVSIVVPNGDTISVQNPFLRYRFHPIEPTFPPPFHSWPTTLRHPTSSRPDAQSNVAQLRSRLAGAQGQISRDTNRLFSIETWPLFSNHSVGSGGSSNSLESIHDTIHVLVGASGHMGNVPVAAFDPIFFLHHCQVDRLLALWSSVHPDVWVPDEEVNTGLTPFWNTSRTYWESLNVRDFPQELNYTYPEFLAENNLNVSALSLGGNAPAPPAGPPPGRPPAVSHVALHVQPPAKAPPAATHAALPVHHHSTDSVLHWTARIRFNQYELGDSFSVLLFLVHVPNDPAEYYKSPYHVGSFHAFVNTASEHCTNCRDNAERGVEGYVHINDSVLKHSEKGSLDPADVVPFLTKNLHWRVLKVDGTVAELPSLEVVTLAAPLTLPPGGKYPVVGEPQHYHEVTRGRPGGSRTVTAA